MTSYHTDQPLEPSDSDLFGRDKFAENIAKVIHSQPIHEKYVIGLYSPWGYGKSSTLNMLQEHLEEGETLTILFNPWVYTDLNSMTVGLLTEIARRINDLELGYTDEQPLNRSERARRWFVRSTKMTKTRGIKNTIAGSIGSIAEATSFSADGLSIGKTVAAAARSVGKDSFSTLKKNVEEAIAQLGKRVVVVIDDVDRLDKDEIFQLFKLVKAVADFKGITYVIAFDNMAVAKALNGRFSGGNDLQAGKDFLEKIIQIPLSLPYIPTEELRSMFFESLNEMLNEYGLVVSDNDNTRFLSIFDDDIMPHLKTPRAVKRYLNLLTFTLPLAGNEVNITDAIVLTGLRLLYPATYENIQREKSLLTGNYLDFMLNDDSHREKNKKKFEKLVVGEEEASSILTSLFPAIQKTYGGSTSWEDSAEKIKENKRVASIDYFDRYFVFGIGKSDVPDEDIKNILRLTDPKKITAALKRLAKDPATQQLIITKIRQSMSLTADSNALLRGLIGATDSLSKSQRAGFWDLGGMDVFANLIFNIIRSQSTDKTKDITDTLELCDNAELLTYIIRDINLAATEKSDESPLLTDKEFEEFKKLAVKKIVDMTKRTIFHKPPHEVSYILYQYWQDYTESNAVEDYLKTVIKSGSDVLDFLTNYLAKWTGGNGQYRGDFNHAAYSTVKKLIDTDFLFEKLLKDDDSLANVEEFVRLEHRDDDTDINKVGNEGSAEFRKILAQEFAYLHLQTKTNKEEGSNSTPIQNQ